MAVNSRAVYDPAKPQTREIFVTISVHSEEAPTLVEVHKDFPLSLLMKYSEVANEYFRSAWSAARTGRDDQTWKLKVQSSGNTVEIGGLQAALKWIIETQPYTGYPNTYHGTKQIPDNRIPADLSDRLHLYYATFQLKISAPLSRTHLRQVIEDQLDNATTPLTADELKTIIKLCFTNPDRRGLVRLAFSRHCEHFLRTGIEMNDQAYKDYKKVYDDAGEDVQKVWDDIYSRERRRIRHEAAAAASAAAQPAAPQAGQS